MNQFPIHFRQHAIPALRTVLAGQALAVAAGSIEFNEAVRAVWEAARARGAMFLPDQTFDELRDWILSTLSAQIDSYIAAEANHCERCDGSGVLEWPAPHACHDCQGTGNPDLAETEATGGA